MGRSYPAAVHAAITTGTVQGRRVEAEIILLCFAYRFGSDLALYRRGLDHRRHSPGGPFEVVGFARLRLKPGSLVFF
jgi:hypothetical protein